MPSSMIAALVWMTTFRRKTASIESRRLKIVLSHNLIATNTIDEWVDTLLNAKHQAARLTQGDISQADFDLAFTHDLSSELKQILAPDQITR